MTNKTCRNEAGIALIIAISLSLMISVMALALMTLSISEKGVSNNQRIAVQALHNADGAVEVARQQMTAFSRAKIDSLRLAWIGTGPIIVDPLDFFPSTGLSFRDDGLGLAVSTTFTFTDSTLHSQSQTFNFRYRSVATGTASVRGERRVISEGTLRLSASRGSFADYLIFTDIHYTPDGQQIWFHTSGYFDGRIHSNGKLRFAYFPTFEDLVTSASQVASYYNYGRPIDLDADRNRDRDVPAFYGGFERAVDPIHLPSNSFSQQRAALGFAALDTTALATSQIKQALGLDPLDPAPVPKGIYVPNDSVSVTGGVYVAGDAIGLRLSVDQYGDQNYLITDENGVTKRIVLDRTNSRTRVYSGTDSTIYSGLPRGMIYLTGGVSHLGGPSRVGDVPPAAIERHTQLTITAVDDILIDRDLTYETYDSGECVLGAYSSGGDVRITTSAPDELVLDVFVLAAGNRGAFRVDSYNRGSYRGQVHLRGGVVERYYGAFGTFSQSGSQTGYGRDFNYDTRGISPPYYPLTQVFKTDQPVPHMTSWLEA
jgi:hypothetical protein